MTAAEFVARLDAENQAALRGLEPDATLKAEVQGALNVPNLLKVALRNEIEATEIAARWLVVTDDVRVKMAFARQVGDEAKHFRMIAERLGQLGVDPDTLDPLAGGFGPLFAAAVHDRTGTLDLLAGLLQHLSQPRQIDRVAISQLLAGTDVVANGRQWLVQLMRQR